MTGATIVTAERCFATGASPAAANSHAVATAAVTNARAVALIESPQRCERAIVTSAGTFVRLPSHAAAENAKL
jgi:hypothetical protein